MENITTQFNALIPRLENYITRSELNSSVEKQFIPFRDVIEQKISDHASQLTSCISAINILKDTKITNNNSEGINLLIIIAYKAELEIKIQKAITASVSEVEKKLKIELQKTVDLLEKKIDNDIQIVLIYSINRVYQILKIF